jgi:hypothetical protein
MLNRLGHGRLGHFGAALGNASGAITPSS